MQRITGTYVVGSTLGEPVRAFVPNALPPIEPDLDSGVWAGLNEAAMLALQRLSAVAGLVPSVDWLIYSAVRQEALLTSQIEGTQATLADLFDDEAGFAPSNTDDVEEVSNYLRAFRLVQAELRDPAGLPLSVRLLCNAHRVLLDGARGKGKQPGELRRSQNWIGGTRPGNAVFVPPPPERVPALLADLEHQLLDLRLKGGCDQAPQAEELAALTKRPEDPLIARVAQELQARLARQEGMDGEAAAVSRAALCELFRLATSP
jgi:hypothetical protein